MEDIFDDKEDMKTLSACITKLNSLGFSVQFKVEEAGLRSLSTDNIHASEDIRVLNFYRFEGESDPADEAILYAIETKDGERGTLIDAYGPENDPLVSEFMLKVTEIAKHVDDNHPMI